MSLFSEPTVHVDPPTRTALVIPLLVGAAIFLAFTLVDWLDSATPQMPVGLIGRRRHRPRWGDRLVVALVARSHERVLAAVGDGDVGRAGGGRRRPGAGRAIFWSWSRAISSHCATHPAARGMANSTVNISGAKPIAW